ncbi:Alpha/Beta hydrolase protein [Phlebopus sp. FC_14]|nr:Alpha/Beta hydrolase protein [Phlebopus sp. FC_14]
MSLPLPTTQWGSPASPKRALLIHGLTSTSLSWYRVASALVVQGYFVMAPDLPGHGTAPRGGDYKLDAITKLLRPYVESTSGPVSLIIGHSLGAVIALLLAVSLPQLPPLSVVLVEPRLRPPNQTPAARQTCEEMESIISMVTCDIRNVSHISIGQVMENNPLWTREDATWKILGLKLCDPNDVNALFRANFPWDFEDLLDELPSHVQATILTADPENKPAITVETLKRYPRVFARAVQGTTHDIHREKPEAIIEAARNHVDVLHQAVLQ